MQFCKQEPKTKTKKNQKHERVSDMNLTGHTEIMEIVIDGLLWTKCHQAVIVNAYNVASCIDKQKKWHDIR